MKVWWLLHQHSWIASNKETFSSGWGSVLLSLWSVLQSSQSSWLWNCPVRAPVLKRDVPRFSFSLQFFLTRKDRTRTLLQQLFLFVVTRGLLVTLNSIAFLIAYEMKAATMMWYMSSIHDCRTKTSCSFSLGLRSSCSTLNCMSSPWVCDDLLGRKSNWMNDLSGSVNSSVDLPVLDADHVTLTGSTHGNTHLMRLWYQWGMLAGPQAEIPTYSWASLILMVPAISILGPCIFGVYRMEGKGSYNIQCPH